jgi:hypothetical protein
MMVLLETKKLAREGIESIREGLCLASRAGRDPCRGLVR